MQSYMICLFLLLLKMTLIEKMKKKYKKFWILSLWVNWYQYWYIGINILTSPSIRNTILVSLMILIKLKYCFELNIGCFCLTLLFYCFLYYLWYRWVIWRTTFNFDSFHHTPLLLQHTNPNNYWNLTGQTVFYQFCISN